MNYHTSIDFDATKNNTNKLLNEYRRLNIDRHKLKLVSNLSAIQYDGMPKSQSNRNSTEEALINDLNDIEEERKSIEFKIALIDKTLVEMTRIDEYTAKLAKLLTLRYIDRFSVTKCCFELSEAFNSAMEPMNGLPMSRNKFYDKRDEALLIFAEVYPKKSDLIEYQKQ
ncbi:hypothetical protein [Lentilactobacillus kosonis]|uniref:Uncharacterized protein n=1 Tax=Lentilactobacillus kosonis TaxID=2810561 RepID=A0A401FPG9_9LACO|nr:hypothetical protein [Lentilactobacillus kosonis]GAY74262.1 hypothetical protein NBRC111893_2408 [Lentilactobacillus kosonis]